MDVKNADKLALEILAILDENLAILSHKQTSRSWAKALKRTALLLEQNMAEKKITAKKSQESRINFPIEIPKDKQYWLEIAKIRLETMLRDEYSLMLTEQSRRLRAILAKMKSKGQKNHKKLMEATQTNMERHDLLRKDLYLFIACAKKYSLAA